MLWNHFFDTERAVSSSSNPPYIHCQVKMLLDSYCRRPWFNRTICRNFLYHTNPINVFFHETIFTSCTLRTDKAQKLQSGHLQSTGWMSISFEGWYLIWWFASKEKGWSYMTSFRFCTYWDQVSLNSSKLTLFPSILYHYSKISWFTC